MLSEYVVSGCTRQTLKYQGILPSFLGLNLEISHWMKVSYVYHFLDSLVYYMLGLRIILPSQTNKVTQKFVNYQ